jgi:hypothetical protein
MSGSRLALQALLAALVPEGKAYFQPPANVEMQYPCITYQRDSARTVFADNAPYRHTKRYQVTVIDRTPDSEIPDKVARLPLCVFQRFFTADNLHHDVFDLYF